MADLDTYAIDLANAGAVNIRCRYPDRLHAPPYLTCLFDGSWFDLEPRLEKDHYKVAEIPDDDLHWFMLRPVE